MSLPFSFNRVRILEFVHVSNNGIINELNRSSFKLTPYPFNKQVEIKHIRVVNICLIPSRKSRVMFESSNQIGS